MELVIFKEDILSWLFHVVFAPVLGLAHLELICWLNFSFFCIFVVFIFISPIFFSDGIYTVYERTKL